MRGRAARELSARLWVFGGALRGGNQQDLEVPPLVPHPPSPQAMFCDGSYGFMARPCRLAGKRVEHFVTGPEVGSRDMRYWFTLGHAPSQSSEFDGSGWPTLELAVDSAGLCSAKPSHPAVDSCGRRTS
jgi:hypothetical protein